MYRHQMMAALLIFEGLSPRPRGRSGVTDPPPNPGINPPPCNSHANQVQLRPLLDKFDSRCLRMLQSSAAPRHPPLYWGVVWASPDRLGQAHAPRQDHRRLLCQSLNLPDAAPQRDRGGLHRACCRRPLAPGPALRLGPWPSIHAHLRACSSPHATAESEALHAGSSARPWTSSLAAAPVPVPVRRGAPCWPSARASFSLDQLLFKKPASAS